VAAAIVTGGLNVDKLMQVREYINSGGEIEQRVNARELHQFLQIGTAFADWIRDRIQQYGFVEGTDYRVFQEIAKNPQGGRPLTEYEVTLGMAKELSMVERNDRGHQARLYFIDCERKVKHQSAVIAALTRADLARMVLEEEAEKKLLAAKIEQDKPKVEFYDDVVDAQGLYDMKQAAKLLGWGPNLLFAHLRGMRILMEKPHNVPRQCYIDQGYFQVKERTYQINGEQHIHCQTFVTPKGLEWLHKVAPTPAKHGWPGHRPGGGGLEERGEMAHV
jgi:anti-repressor protein